MMKTSKNGGSVNYTPITSSQQTTIPNAIPSLMAGNLESTQTTANPVFKSIIEKKAAENNLLFVPQHNRYQEGKQIYKLGNISIYLDRNVVFYLTNGQWTPTSINEVIKNAL